MIHTFEHNGIEGEVISTEENHKVVIKLKDDHPLFEVTYENLAEPSMLRALIGSKPRIDDTFGDTRIIGYRIDSEMKMGKRKAEFLFSRLIAALNADAVTTEVYYV